MATTIFTPQMLRNGTRAVTEIPAGSSFSNIYSFEFEGVDGWINCGEIPPLFKYYPIGTASSNPWSASMWVKGSGSNKGFFEIPYKQVNALYARSFAFVKGTSYLYFGGKYAGIKIKESGTTAYSNTEWNHIVMTFDGVDHTALSSYTLYVGGISVGIALITPNIGAIWNRVLSLLIHKMPSRNSMKLFALFMLKNVLEKKLLNDLDTRSLHFIH